jgi:hypothetical protein
MRRAQEDDFDPDAEPIVLGRVGTAFMAHVDDHA